MKISSIKAIIFDMDGVLLLSTPAHEYAYKKTLEEIGIGNILYSRFAGMRTDECIKIILKENSFNTSPEFVSTLAKRKSYLSNTYMKENVPLVPECKKILGILREKFRLALASSASVNNIELFLQASGCREFFEVIVDGMQVKEAKPDPDIYILTLMKLRLQPEECLVIEDAVNGVIAAKAAGMFVYGLPGVSTEDELKNAGTDAILSNIKDIVNELAVTQ